MEIQVQFHFFKRTLPTHLPFTMSDDEEYEYGEANSKRFEQVISCFIIQLYLPLVLIDTDYGSGDDQGSDNEQEGDDREIEIENAFYEGDDMKADNLHGAMEKFQFVVTMETARECEGLQIKWSVIYL